ncbi:MAG TPA: hypothetical protein VGG28_16330 [Kofleriaceae bacterium]
MVLVACNSNNGVKHIADAPPQHDATSDATGQDGGAAGSASVTVTVGGTGKLGLTVYFQGADSTLNTTATTDSTGTATGVVGTGGFITVIIPPATVGNPDELVTWSMVQPGDHVVLAEGGPAITASFTIPTISPYTTYHVATTCGTTTLTVSVLAAFPASVSGSGTEFVDCNGPQDIEVVALDGNLQAQQSFFIANQTISTANLSLVGQTYGSAAQRTYTWDNFTDPGTLEMTDTLNSPLGQTYSSAELAAAGTPPTVTRNAPAFGTLTDVVGGELTVGNTAHSMFEWGQGETYVGDWGDHRLGDFSIVPAYDPSVQQVSWTTANAGIQPNVAFTIVTAQRTSDMHKWEWVVAGGGSPIQLPTLPTTLYDWNIAAADTPSVLTVEMLATPGDPGAARANFLGTLGEAALETGTAGVLSVASIDNLREAVSRLRLPFSRR